MKNETPARSVRKYDLPTAVTFLLVGVGFGAMLALALLPIPPIAPSVSQCA
jgi:hypothetical protein